MNIDHSAPYISTVEEIITAQECHEWIQFIDNQNPQIAPLHTHKGEVYKPDYRNNERVMKSDPDYADYLYQKLKSELPQTVFGWSIAGLNELFRCYRYKPGMKFAPHSDGFYGRSQNERSFYTLLLYLNEVEAGGDTGFFVTPEVKISPKAGLALAFQHEIFHEGCEVKAGVKYVLRTDVMYRRTD
ncbi:2OG-Fe(II) oxygenase [Hahella sp. KA22]|uniref:2OG-Fe(II) oxygenase n=1 Tax=Hahella sp. KA22 TaxID=1628392 RepID=UPI000FDCF91E|nr:2OG-Fe(II) oxygenase [Hahella sp. KA22]AZZ91612.1 2OG-Fe(II) oxygenase [Hahella sp. KA22]QAY54982.1 2OG-Fe(II) oxygenase [Hahella sp. KA22]